MDESAKGASVDARESGAARWASQVNLHGFASWGLCINHNFNDLMRLYLTNNRSMRKLTLLVDKSELEIPGLNIAPVNDYVL